MYSGDYKAVCYQCSFEGSREVTRCPVCKFALILEPENTPAGGRRLASILSRPTVREGGPPLPGVDAEKRQAQLRAERRRVRRASSISATTTQHARPTTQPLVGSTSMASEAHRSPWQTVKYTFLCVSAVAAGVVAAALQTGSL